MNTIRTVLLGTALLSIAACNPTGNGSTDTAASSSSSLSLDMEDQVTRNVLYTGLLQEAGPSIFMQGSHTLTLADGRFILLESESIFLNRYEGQEVEVFGSVRPTVEAGGIIMSVESITSLEASSSSSADARQLCGGIAGIACPTGMECIDDPNDSCDPALGGADCSGICVQEQGSTVSTSASSAISSALPASSAVAVSSQAVTSQAPDSTWQASGVLQAKAETMAKDDMSQGQWTQEYCSSHIGFCIPVHKNWWYNSFGATAASYWHVEIGPEEISSLGDGPITVQLVQGDTNQDGAVQAAGEGVVGYRSWTGGRHFEVRGPASLLAAVEHITENLVQSAAE